jgi:hypothetical protein
MLEGADVKSESGKYVKCQRCKQTQRITGTLMRHAANDRAATLRRRIQWAEERRKYFSDSDKNIKTAKQELEQLQQEEAQYDKLRSLPLYYCSSGMTRFKFVCGTCFDKLYATNNNRRHSG